MLLHDYFDYYAREQGGVDCIIQEDVVLTYAMVLERANRLANALLEAGLTAGDRFALLSKNSAEMVIIYLAGSKTGIVPVPLNWRLAPPEWAYIINDAGAKLLIAETAFCPGIDAVRADLGMVEKTIAMGQSVPEGWDDFDAWWKTGSPEAPPVELSEADVLYQMYTSGTTGHPKGAMLPHHSVLSNSMQTLPIFKSAMGPGTRTLIVMPMFHAGGASFVFGTLISGATMVIHNDFSPERLATALSDQNINVVNLVPAMIQTMLVQVPDLAERCYDNLEVIIYGASAIAEDTLRRAMTVFGCDFYQGYGQTESSAAMTLLTAADHRRALAGKPELLLSAGRAIVGTTLRIVDDQGQEVPRGEVGEIVMRGPQAMKGYWNLPEATASTLVDGWLHTGDAAFMDEEGYIYIQDRIKDMIVSGGENVYSREVENMLFGHPAISDAAVIGVPDEKYGEAILAILVLRKGKTTNAEELIAYCRTKLGGYKIPRRFEFVDELPRNTAGKVLKKDLRKPYWK